MHTLQSAWTRRTREYTQMLAYCGYLSVQRLSFCGLANGRTAVICSASFSVIVCVGPDFRNMGKLTLKALALTYDFQDFWIVTDVGLDASLQWFERDVHELHWNSIFVRLILPRHFMISSQL